MTRPDSIPTDLDSEDAAFFDAVEAADRSLKLGHKIAYAEVRRWMLSWGTDTELPPPECP